MRTSLLRSLNCFLPTQSLSRNDVVILSSYVIVLSFLDCESRHCVMAFCVESFYPESEVTNVKTKQDINFHIYLFVFGD